MRKKSRKERRAAQRAEDKAKAALIPAPGANTGSEPVQPKRPLLTWLKGSGVASIAFGLYGLIQDPRLFWWAVGCFYAGLIVLAVDLYFEEIGGKNKICIALVGVGIAAAVAINLIFVSAPLQIIMDFKEDGTLSRSNVLAWKPNYSELNVRITNNSDLNYDDIVFVFKPELMVAEAGIASGNCSNGNLEFAGSFSFADRKLPLPETDNGPKMGLLATDGGYKFRCDRLPRKGGYVEIIFALVGDKEEIRQRAEKAFHNGPGPKGWVGLHPISRTVIRG